ncbi:hypothetical protein Q7P36_007413 [Cladosporium allicinum]
MVFVQRDGSHASALAYTPTSSPTTHHHTTYRKHPVFAASGKICLWSETRVGSTSTGVANSLVNNEDLRGTGTEDPRSVTGQKGVVGDRADVERATYHNYHTSYNVVYAHLFFFACDAKKQTSVIVLLVFLGFCSQRELGRVAEEELGQAEQQQGIMLECIHSTIVGSHSPLKNEEITSTQSSNTYLYSVLRFDNSDVESNNGWRLEIGHDSAELTFDLELATISLLPLSASLPPSRKICELHHVSRQL